jgi:phage terminase small subunit
MTPKQQLFVAEYLKDLNATQAAIRCGYSEKTANREGSRLLSKVDIQTAIAERQRLQLERADLTATRVLEEMRRLAFSDVRELFDAQGNLRPIHTLTPEQSACISGLEVIIKNAKAGDGVTDTVHKVKVWDKPKVLDLLGKHFGLLAEQVHHTGELRISWQS